MANASLPERRDTNTNPPQHLPDPLICLRELVKNSLDAASPEIDIRCSFSPPKSEKDGALGVSTIEVVDTGRGMDLEILQTRFTRFARAASQKELHSLGSLGIGFVSLFALRPDAVCVDTFRGGEGWRVLFRSNLPVRSFPLDERGIGTRVQIIRAASASTHETTVTRAREVLRTWCRHCSAEIRFQGEIINESLDVEALCKVRYLGEDLEIVAGYPRDGEPFYGFYRNGLTLLDTSDGPWGEVVFKIDARNLRHALDRKDVLRDEAYRRAVDRLERLLREDLPTRLLRQIDHHLRSKLESTAGVATREGAHGGEHSSALHELYQVAARVMGRDSGKSPWPRSADSRVVSSSIDGRPVTVRELQEAADSERLFFAPADSPLTVALADTDQLVLRVTEGDSAFAAISSWLGEPPRPVYEWYCKPAPARSDEEAASWIPLGQAAARLLLATSLPISGVEVAHFTPDGLRQPQPPAVTQASFGELTAHASSLPLGAIPPDDRRLLVVNADHPQVEKLLTLAHHEPDLALLFLLRLLTEHSVLDTATEGNLIQRCLEQRARPPDDQA